MLQSVVFDSGPLERQTAARQPRIRAGDSTVDTSDSVCVASSEVGFLSLSEPQLKTNNTFTQTQPRLFLGGRLGFRVPPCQFRPRVRIHAP